MKRDFAARPARLGLRPTALAAAAWFAIAAQAQTAPADDVQQPAAAKGKVQEIVITAERRATNAQTTAASVTAQSGEELRTKGVTTLETVLDDIPSVAVQDSPQGGSIYIRGVGSNGDSNWIDPSVALSLDGVYSGRAERIFASMYDVARVEVLRGPQGTLYGRNATGGSVNVITNNPTRKFAAGVETQFGNYDLWHIDGFVNVPLSDTLAMRVAVERERRKGYFSNGADASNLTNGRVKLLWQPTKGFSLLGMIDSFNSNALNRTTVPRPFTGGPPGFNWATNYSNPWEVDPLHPADVDRNRFLTYSLEANADLGFGVLTLQPTYTYNSRYSAGNVISGTAQGAPNVPPLTADQLYAGSWGTWTEGQHTFEARLTSEPAAAVKWVAGVYDFDSKNRQTGIPPSTGGGPPVNFQVDGLTVPTTSKAVFGQATFPIDPTMRVTAGLRYTRDSKTYKYLLSSNSNWTGTPYNSGPQSVPKSYASTTYKLALEKDLAPTSLLYAQLASGYKAGGFSTNATPPVAFDPEHLTAFELGSKNRFLDGRLQLNGDVYYYLYKNFQAQYPDFNAPSPIPGDTSSVFDLLVVNAGQGKTSGFEVDTKYRVLDDTELHAALTYTHARYGDFATPALSVFNGSKVTMTPSWTLALGAEQSWSLGDGTLNLGGQIKFSDGYIVTIQQGLPGGDSNNYQGSFHKTDLHLGYTPNSDRWNVSLWLRNLENNAQYTNEQPFGRMMITSPRTFGVNFGAKF